MSRAVIKCATAEKLDVSFPNWPEGTFEGNFEFGGFTTVAGKGKFKRIKVGGQDTVIVTEMALDLIDPGMVYVDLLKADATDVEDAILADLQNDGSPKFVGRRDEADEGDWGW